MSETERYSKAVEICNIATTATWEEGRIFDASFAGPKVCRADRHPGPMPQVSARECGALADMAAMGIGLPDVLIQQPTA